MTRKWAMLMMWQGHKVTHQSFTPNEYLHVVNGFIVTEDGREFGSILPHRDFMADGWSTWREPEDKGL